MNSCAAGDVAVLLMGRLEGLEHLGFQISYFYGTAEVEWKFN